MRRRNTKNNSSFPYSSYRKDVEKEEVYENWRRRRRRRTRGGRGGMVGEREEKEKKKEEEEELLTVEMKGTTCCDKTK
jgi:hypothetical protein